MISPKQISGILKYTVGSAIQGGRFATIQAAIDQAIADGATGLVPAEIFILPGFYTENLTATNGGIILRGSQVDTGVAINGTVTFTNDPTGDSLWGIVSCFVTGLVTVTGAATGTCSIGIDLSTLNGGLDFSASATAFNTLIARVSSIYRTVDAIVPASGATNSINLLQCTVISNDLDQALSHNGILDAFYTRFIGQVVQTASTSIWRCHFCNFHTEDQGTLVLNNAANVEVYNCSFEIDGTPGTPIAKSGAGLLEHSGNSYIGSISNPPVDVIAGTELLGKSLEGLSIQVNTATTGQRPIINLEGGINMNLSGGDDAANNRVSILLNSSDGHQTFPLPMATSDAPIYSGSETALYSRFVMTAGAIVTRLAAWISNTAAGNLQMGIYDAAGALIQSTAITPIGPDGLQVVPLAGAAFLFAGNTYTLALWTDSPTAEFPIISGRSTTSAVLIGQIETGLAAGLPATITGVAEATRVYVGALPA